MAVSFEKIGDLCATFLGYTKVGDVVTITDNNEVTKAVADDAIAGIVIATDGDISTVQLKGFMKFTCADTVLDVGRQIIVAAGSNEVASGEIDEGGLPVLVVSSDSETNEIVALV